VASYRELSGPLPFHYSALSPSAAGRTLIQVGLTGLIRAAELFYPGLGENAVFKPLPGKHIRTLPFLHYFAEDTAAPIRLPRRPAGTSKTACGQLSGPAPWQAGREPNARDLAPPLLGPTSGNGLSTLRGPARRFLLDLHGIEWAARRTSRQALAQGLRKEGHARSRRGSIRPASGWSGGWSWRAAVFRQAAKAMNVRSDGPFTAPPHGLVELRSRLKESSQDLSSELRVHPRASVASSVLMAALTGRQLAVHTVAPEGEHAQLALLVGNGDWPRGHCCCRSTAEGGKQGGKWFRTRRF